MGVISGCGCKEVYRFPHTTVFLRLNAAAFNRQGYCSAAAFIRGRRLIEGGIY